MREFFDSSQRERERESEFLSIALEMRFCCIKNHLWHMLYIIDHVIGIHIHKQKVNIGRRETEIEKEREMGWPIGEGQVAGRCGSYHKPLWCV